MHWKSTQSFIKCIQPVCASLRLFPIVFVSARLPACVCYESLVVLRHPPPPLAQLISSDWVDTDSFLSSIPHASHPTNMAYWKAAGLSYLQYVGLATTALRQVRRLRKQEARTAQPLTKQTPDTTTQCAAIIAYLWHECNRLLSYYSCLPSCNIDRPFSLLVVVRLQSVKPSAVSKYLMKEDVHYKKQTWTAGKPGEKSQ